MIKRIDKELTKIPDPCPTPNLNAWDKVITQEQEHANFSSNPDLKLTLSLTSESNQ